VTSLHRIPSGYVTSQPGQVSLLRSAERETSTEQGTVASLCDWEGNRRSGSTEIRLRIASVHKPNSTCSISCGFVVQDAFKVINCSTVYFDINTTCRNTFYLTPLISFTIRDQESITKLLYLRLQNLIILFLSSLRVLIYHIHSPEEVTMATI